MKTPLGDIHDSWNSIIGQKASLLMLETIRDVCMIPNDNNIFRDFSMSLEDLKIVVIADNKWGPYDEPLYYDESFPAVSVERVCKTMGKYPKPRTWAAKGVLGLTFPMYIPDHLDIRRARSVWEGWVHLLIKGLSSRKKNHEYAFLLMGREAGKLSTSITASMPLIRCPDPSLWDYSSVVQCPFKMIAVKAKIEIDW